MTELDGPAGPGSAEPHLSSIEDGAVLSWLEPDGPDHALRLARWTADGWGAVRTVVSRSDLFVNWADFPSVVPLDSRGRRLAAHWLQSSGPEVLAYGVRVATSDDGGATWSAPWTPHDDGTPTEHGFVSLLPGEGGGYGLVWLDGRAFAPGTDGAPPSREMSLRFRAVGPDADRGTSELLDGRTCDCCQTGMTRTDEGLLVVYRDRSEDEVRDIHAVRRVDGRWTEPRPVHDDGWVIESCPVNGPQVEALGRRAAVAWFTGAQDRPRVLLARSEDAGASFAEPVRVDDGNPGGRVDLLLLDDGSALVSWIERVPREGGGAAAEIRVRRVSPDGTADPPVTVAASTAGRASGFPRMTRVPAGALVAWTDVPPDGGESRLRTAVLEIARTLDTEEER